MCWSLVSQPRLLLAYPRCGLYLTKEWQQGVPCGQLRSFSFTFEPGPSSGQGIGFSQAFVRGTEFTAVFTRPKQPRPLLHSRHCRQITLPQDHSYSPFVPVKQQTKLYLEKLELFTYGHSHDFFLLCPPFVVSGNSPLCFTTFALLYL